MTCACSRRGSYGIAMSCTPIQPTCSRWSRDGCERLRIGTRQEIAPAGSIIIVHPEECHDGEAGVAEGWSYRTLYPSVPLMCEVSRELGHQATPVFGRRVIDDHSLAGMLLRAHQAAEGNDPDEAELVMLKALRMLIMRYADNGDGSETDDRSGARRRFALYADAVDPKQGGSSDLRRLAQLADVTRFQVIRDFKRVTGLTPGAYVRNRRLRLAGRLIEQGAPIVEAALAAGFADQSHLSRSFRSTARHHAPHVSSRVYAGTGVDGMTTGRCLCGTIQYRIRRRADTRCSLPLRELPAADSLTGCHLRHRAKGGAALYARATQGVCVLARGVPQLLPGVRIADVLSDGAATGRHRSVSGNPERTRGDRAAMPRACGGTVAVVRGVGRPAAISRITVGGRTDTDRAAALASCERGWRRLHQPRLPDRGGDEAGKQRVRLERLRLQLGMVLHADEPRVIGAFDDLWQYTVR